MLSVDPDNDQQGIHDILQRFTRGHVFQTLADPLTHIHARKFDTCCSICMHSDVRVGTWTALGSQNILSYYLVPTRSWRSCPAYGWPMDGSPSLVNAINENGQTQWTRDPLPDINEYTNGGASRCRIRDPACLWYVVPNNELRIIFCP